MKYKGCKMEFHEERIADLMRVYDQFIANARHISLPDIYASIVNMPSRRFWVSTQRAVRVCRKLLLGNNVLDTMHPSRREMFAEIFSRVRSLQEKRPNDPLEEICEEVVNQPAPKFYLAPDSVKVIIGRERRRWNQQKNAKTLSLALTAMCLVLFCLPIEPASVGLAHDSQWWHRLTFHFFHANIFHLALNCWAMLCAVFVYPLRPWHMLVALVMAALYPPIWLSTVPTVGMSGMVFALFGMIAPIVRRKMYYNGWMAFYIVVGFLFTTVNGGIHLFCYLAGMAFGLVSWQWKKKS